MNKLTAILSLSVALLFSMTAACGGDGPIEERGASSSNLEGDDDSTGGLDPGASWNDQTEGNDNRDFDADNYEGTDTGRGAEPAGHYAGQRCYDRCIGNGGSDCSRCWELN